MPSGDPRVILENMEMKLDSEWTKLMAEEDDCGSVSVGGHLVRSLDWLQEKISQEGDKKEWTAHGFLCLILRNPRMQNLCGYVGVNKDHHFFEQNVDDDDVQLDVHGGLTFAGAFEDYPDLWFFGFDAAHGGDLVPRMVILNFYSEISGDLPEYRDMEYMTRETEKLAEQLQVFQD